MINSCVFQWNNRNMMFTGMNIGTFHPNFPKKSYLCLRQIRINNSTALWYTGKYSDVKFNARLYMLLFHSFIDFYIYLMQSKDQVE